MGKALFALLCAVLISIVVSKTDKGGRRLTKEPGRKNAKILGGWMAAYKHRRGTAMIFYVDEYGYPYSLCTGSMISQTMVLTAAHCVTDYDGSYDGFVYGVIPASKFGTMKEYYDHGILASSVHVHSSYNGVNYGYDVAIIELESRIPWNRYKQVEFVDPPRDNTFMMAVGYGLIDNSGSDELTEPLRLMSTNLKYRDFWWCSANDPLESPNEGEMVCAVSTTWPRGKTGTCNGDSGGPLFIIRNDATLQQVGLLSYGNGKFCGEYASFDWYVRTIHVSSAVNDLARSKNKYKSKSVFKQYKMRASSLEKSRVFHKIRSK